MESKHLALLRVDYYKKSSHPDYLERERARACERDMKGKSNVKIQGSKHPKLLLFRIILLNYNPYRLCLFL